VKSVYGEASIQVKKLKRRRRRRRNQDEWNPA
jgi:hypothetical protein